MTPDERIRCAQLSTAVAMERSEYVTLAEIRVAYVAIFKQPLVGSFVVAGRLARDSDPVRFWDIVDQHRAVSA